MADQVVKDAVDVIITSSTNIVERTNYGTILFIGDTVLSPVIRVATYQSIDEVALKFGLTDPEYLAAQAFFSQGGNARKLKIGYKASGETYTQALTAIRNVDNDFYAIAIESVVKAEQTALATSVLALGDEKVLFLRSDDGDIDNIAVSTDASSVIQATNNDQVAMFFDNSIYKPERLNGVFPEVGLLAQRLTIPETRTTAPGSNNWVHTNIIGVSGGTLTSAEKTALIAKNTIFLNYSSNPRIISRTHPKTGRMLGGEFIDVVHGKAWFKSRLQENIYDLFTSYADRNSKIPYTQQGIHLVADVVKKTHQDAVATGLFAPEESDAEINVLDISETSVVDRANRDLRAVTFKFRLAGAINTAFVTGSVYI